MSSTLEPFWKTVKETVSSIPSSVALKDTSSEENEEFPCKSLSYTERMIGFATCMLCGYLLSFVSMIKFLKLLKGDPVPFVVLWTMGNVVTLLGVCFLAGFESQMKAMFHHDRIGASMAYLISIILTIGVVVICKLKPDSLLPPLVLVVLMIVQCLVVLWYCLSYIPFARDLVKRWISGGDKRLEGYETIV